MNAHDVIIIGTGAGDVTPARQLAPSVKRIIRLLAPTTITARLEVPA